MSQELENKVAELETALAASKAETAAAQAEIQNLTEQSQAVIDDLKSKLDEKTKTTVASKIIVKSGDKKYEVVIPRFQFEGKTVTAEELKKNPELVAKLVEIGAGALKLVS